MEWTLTDVLVDFAMVSVLLMIAAWLRRKIPFLQRYYIPAALIAGLLGMVLGPQVLGKVSPIYLNYSPAINNGQVFISNRILMFFPWSQT